MASIRGVPHRPRRPAGVDLSRWLPPLRDRRFWVVQALVVGIFLTHELVVGDLWSRPSIVVPHAAIHALYLAPVLYAALRFPLSGALATAIWVTAVVLSDFVTELSRTTEQVAVEEIAFLVMLDVVAAFVAVRMAAELGARQAAERAGAAAQRAEARYRALFAANTSPAIVLDDAGLVHEVNDAARALLAASDPALGTRWSGAAEVGAVEGRSLNELLGPALAAGVLHGDGRVTLRSPHGYEIVVRPHRTVVGRGGDRLVQILLDDVTTEERGRQRAEAFAAYVLKGQEDERARLARELYDETVQELVDLCRQLDTVGGGEALPTTVVASLRESRTLVEDIVSDLRNIARGLRPPELDDLGLAISLRRLATDAAGRAGLLPDVDVDETACRGLSDAIDVVLFRIAQEALNNVERHARASHVSLIVSRGPDAVRLEVADDGIGFEMPDPTGTAAPAVQLGVLGMFERAAIVGGRVEVHSAPRSGTRVMVTLPTQGHFVPAGRD